MSEQRPGEAKYLINLALNAHLEALFQNCPELEGVLRLSVKLGRFSRLGSASGLSLSTTRGQLSLNGRDTSFEQWAPFGACVVGEVESW